MTGWYWGWWVFFLLSARSVAAVVLPSTLSDEAQISVLTLYPTPHAVYTLFGHTLVRVQDSGQAPPLDVAFNYGVFHFSRDFYREYLRGNLRYYVQVESYEEAYQHYAEKQDRSLHEQVLRLSNEEKNKLYALLVRDMRWNNPYLYNYFTNNCSSRVRDVIEESLGGTLSYAPHCTERHKAASYRSLFIEKFKPNYPWTRWMVVLCVGALGDKPLTYRERMFLPEHLKEGLSCARTHRNGREEVLVRSSAEVHQRKTPKPQIPWWQRAWGPTPLGVLLLCLTMGVTYVEAKSKRYHKWLDGLLFSILTALGLLLLFLWLFTKHSSTANYHLIWTAPTHVLAFYGLKTAQRQMAIIYWRLVFGCWLLFFGWIAFGWPLTQHNMWFLPLMGALLIRVVHRAPHILFIAPRRGLL